MSIKVIKIKSINVVSSSNEKFTVCSFPLIEDSYNDVVSIAKSICYSLNLIDSKQVTISLLTSNGTYTIQMNFNPSSNKDSRNWNIVEQNLQTL